jgi:hypothetical protein
MAQAAIVGHIVRPTNLPATRQAMTRILNTLQPHNESES